MEALHTFWLGLAPRARLGLALGSAVVLALAVTLGVWAYRPNYQVLFADLAPRDAAAMAAELDKQKTPYQLSGNGSTILVPQEQVYRTRLKLMGKDLPLHGAVGFEVFNNADFGMTDFVQKVNYQRAIQGELTRTIQSIDEVASARVHLAIPEQGLFRQGQSKPKASVSLAMKDGLKLAPEQIAGIARLIAASVPDIQAEDVTVLDQHGVALSRQSAADPMAEPANGQLDAKRSTEDYLQKKVAQVLDKSFGSGAAVASVDVLLNLDQNKITTENVLPAREGANGVLVRERRSSHAAGPAASGPAAPGDSSHEADYQVGRRVEQLTVAPGAIKRMTVAVLVKTSLSEDQAAKLKELVAHAIGANLERGDAIAVESMDRFAQLGPRTAAPASAGPAPAPALLAAPASAGPGLLVAAVLGGLLLLLLTVLGLWRLLAAPTAAPLDPAARQRLLQDLRQWMEQDAPAEPRP